MPGTSLEADSVVVRYDMGDGTSPDPWQGHLIRAIDVLVSLIVLFVLLPILLIVALLVKITRHCPILFAHRRIGLGGQTFACCKFRTMQIDAKKRLKRILATDPAARAEWEKDHKLRNDSMFITEKYSDILIMMAILCALYLTSLQTSLKIAQASVIAPE